MQTIYIDVLVGVNVYINYLILILTARFAGCKPVRVRIVLASLAGALSACTILLNIPSKIIGILIKITVAAIMTIIAFEIKSRRMFLKIMLILTTVTFGFAGAMIGIKNIMSTNSISVSNYTVYLDISPLALILFTLVCYVLLSLCSKIIAKKTQRKSFCRLTICSEGKTVTIDGLLDTGNNLTEPFSGLPVVVVSEKSIYNLIPEGVKSFGTANSGSAGKIRLIPYSSVGGNGLLAGFMPDSITVESEGKEKKTENVYIAVADRESEMPALINPDILE